MINTELNFELTNGVSVKLTLNFASLLKVKAQYPDIYEGSSKIILYGKESQADLFDFLNVIYTAYLCANIDNTNKLDKETFYSLVPFNLSLLMETQNKLLGFDKKK